MPENENLSEVLPEAEEPVLNFQKGKMIGNATYKNVRTKVTISDSSLSIVKLTKKAFRKEQKEERTFNYADISSASVHTVMDFWDTLYAVITALLGIFINPLLFLFTAVCLWTGYGKKIKLVLHSGEKYEIPLSGSKEKERAELLINICNNQKI